MEACLLPFEMNKLGPQDGSFLIHLGDIRTGKPNPSTGRPFFCPESIFQELATTLVTAPLPVFAVPGDNGWLDCSNTNQAFQFWDDYLFDMNEDVPYQVHRWNSFPPGVARTTPQPGLFSFLLQGNVLVVGQVLPAGRNGSPWPGHGALERDNIRWLQDNFDHYRSQLQAVVILAHSVGFNGNFARRLEQLATSSQYGRPSILVLEDAHQFSVQFNYRRVNNMMVLRTDDTVTPIQITIHPSASGGVSNVFRWDRRCPCSTNHGPTQLVTHDAGRCAGMCVEAHNACRSKERCEPGLQGVRC